MYDKITTYAKDLVAVGDKIATMYGVPVVNKRVSVTPISLVGAASGGYLPIALAMDRAAAETGIDFIGGYTALVQKGATPGEEAFLETGKSILAALDRICGEKGLSLVRRM